MAVPTANPLTIPLTEPPVAFAILLLLPVPPVVASLNVMDEPMHANPEPVILDGFGRMVFEYVT